MTYGAVWKKFTTITVIECSSLSTTIRVQIAAVLKQNGGGGIHEDFVGSTQTTEPIPYSCSEIVTFT